MSKPRFQLDDVKQKASGLWQDVIFPRFNIDVRFKKKTPCPACGGTDRFRYDDKKGSGDYICQHCGPGDGFNLISKVTGLSFPEVLSEVASIVGLDATSNITDEDRARWKKEQEWREKERLEMEFKRQDQIARKAEGIWRGAYLGEESPYLKAKQVDKDPKVKITHDGNVLIPAYDAAGKMWNLQTIESDGHKYFITGTENADGSVEYGGGRTGGCFFIIGEIQPDLYDNHIICIAEGYATGMSIHMATGHPVALAFVANNIPKVGIALKQKYPKSTLVYCADDDSAKQDTGLKCANQAHAATGGIVILPDFTQVKGSS
ncbi:primase-helicase zinc-binding domain-containing protein [Acinetobacter radioresistens]|uniref:primase-helicase zinc-binding domain-containing protein n=1 Tax=Acinetobacter radioresistens TaxID=40216 RepID=UPI003215C1A8